MATSAVTVAPGAGFTSATATVPGNANDTAGIVTFTTSSTIPGSGPYLLFTLTWGGSWASTYANQPAIAVFPCANGNNARTASQQAATAALGPFFVIPASTLVSAAVYCTNAPAQSTAYDIGYTATQGP